MERGQAGGMTLESIRRCLAVLEVRAALQPSWRGAGLDQLLDADHAALQAAWAHRLQRWGWRVWAEVSFNRYGDRGRVDLVAWDPPRRILLIGEVKSQLADVQGLLGPMDVKVRVAPAIAASLGLGRPRLVVPLLLVLETSTARRRVARLAPLFGRFTHRGRVAIGSLRHPERLDPGDGLLVLSVLPPVQGHPARRAGGDRTARPMRH